MPVPAEANPQAGTERSLPLPSAPSPLGRLTLFDNDDDYTGEDNDDDQDYDEEGCVYSRIYKDLQGSELDKAI